MWPEGMRAAAALTFDFDAEEVWIGEDPENANKPGVLSQGTYGAKVANSRRFKSRRCSFFGFSIFPNIVR